MEVGHTSENRDGGRRAGPGHWLRRQPDQVAAAGRHCSGLTNVTIETGDLAGLAIGDETVDAVVAVQALEYVADVDRALREIRRVSRPGGRLVNVATNWSALFWSGGDPSLTSAVLTAWEQHTSYPNLPVELPRRLHAAGFGATTQQPLTIVNRRFHPNSFSWWAAQLMGAYASATARSTGTTSTRGFPASSTPTPRVLTSSRRCRYSPLPPPFLAQPH